MPFRLIIKDALSGFILGQSELELDLAGHPGRCPRLTDEGLGCRHVVTPSSYQLSLGCDYNTLAGGSSRAM